jgi:Ca2+-dependent lipid-binding protein
MKISILAVAVDLSSQGPTIPPTITIQDVDKASKEEIEQPTVTPSSATTPPGALPDAPAPVIPEWYRTGWKAVAGVADGQVPPSEEQVIKSTLETFLSEVYYGQWYHNAGIVLFAVLATHLATLLRLGFGWILVILAISATYYKTSIQRVRRYARDDIQRELLKTRLATEHESADWLNNFLDRFWLMYEPQLSKSIVGSVDLILQASTPSFLDSLRLSTFTLGTKAPRIDRVRTFPRSEPDIVMMDWSIKFTPSDLIDVTPRQQALQVNPKIVLDVRVGKGLATAAIPILLEDINFEGHLRIKLKLMSNFPHVQLVEISFLERPIIDYVLKPIGGETFGWDVGNVRRISSVTCAFELTECIRFQDYHLSYKT